VKPQDLHEPHAGDVAAAVRFYTISAAGEVLVAHDELDLPAGTVRLKLGGGARRAQRPA
jgi:PTH1 family peptidyl-tRNA hydrolase